MKRQLLLSLLLLISCQWLYSSVQLSEGSKISLLTCSSGEELYSVFGHSAIRVNDPDNKIDLVYNYGTFDFSTSYFYFKFAHGNLNYMLASGQFRYFLPGYVMENRSVKEQILNLSQKERQKLFDAIIVNSQPENRNYRYDFFYDNCATRIRDIVLKSIEGQYVIDKESTHNMTMRQLYGQYLNKSLWTQFGIHLLLGMKADVLSTPYTEMYLPDYLSNQFSGIYIIRPDSTKEKLVESTNVLLERGATIEADKQYLTPQIVFIIFMIVIIFISLLERKYKWNLIIFDRLLIMIIGLIGLLLWYLCFISNHTTTGWNFNIMWALPTNIVLALIGRKTYIFRFLMIISLIGTLIFLIAFQFIPQQFPEGLVFLLLGLIIRINHYVEVEKWFKKTFKV